MDGHVLDPSSLNHGPTAVHLNVESAVPVPTAEKARNNRVGALNLGGLLTRRPPVTRVAGVESEVGAVGEVSRVDVHQCPAIRPMHRGREHVRQQAIVQKEHPLFRHVGMNVERGLLLVCALPIASVDTRSSTKLAGVDTENGASGADGGRFDVGGARHRAQGGSDRGLASARKGKVQYFITPNIQPYLVYSAGGWELRVASRRKMVPGGSKAHAVCKWLMCPACLKHGGRLFCEIHALHVLYNHVILDRVLNLDSSAGKGVHVETDGA